MYSTLALVLRQCCVARLCHAQGYRMISCLHTGACAVAAAGGPSAFTCRFDPQQSLAVLGKASSRLQLQ
jgi:hypothetical protein